MSQGVIIMIRKCAEFCWTRVTSLGSLSLQKLMLAVMLLVSVNSAMAAVLQDVSYAVLPGNRVEIRLSMSEAVSVSSEFTTNNPARISMDFLGLSSALARKNTRIDSGEVIGVTALEVQGKMRIVIALLEMDAYTTRQEGSDFVITIGSASGKSSNYQEPITSTNNSYGSSSNNSISGLDFRRGTGGEGQIILSLSNSEVSVDLRQEGRKVIADFLDTGMADSLLRKLDVIDFATPASYIQTVRIGNKIRLTIDTENDFEYLAYQTDNTFTIELKPLSEFEAEKIRAEKKQFVGERLSLMFQDIEIRAVLQIIAQHTNLNLVASDTVRGNLTLRLQNVPWDQALDIILKTKGLDKRIDGNVMLVAPAKEISDREEQELNALQEVEKLSPLRTELIQINYAEAEDIAALLKAGDSSLLSERGNVSVDVRTNSLLVQDTAAKLEEVRDLAKKLISQNMSLKEVMDKSGISRATYFRLKKPHTNKISTSASF